MSRLSTNLSTSATGSRLTDSSLALAFPPSNDYRRSVNDESIHNESIYNESIYNESTYNESIYDGSVYNASVDNASPKSASELYTLTPHEQQQSLPNIPTRLVIPGGTSTAGRPENPQRPSAPGIVPPGQSITNAQNNLNANEDQYGPLPEGGEAGLSESGGMGGMDPQDLSSQLLGGGGGSRSPGPRKSEDLIHRVNVSLEELYKGKTTKLALMRLVICPKCDGKGGKEGAARPCGSCQGRGVRVTPRQMGPMIQQLQQRCDACSGTGEIINHRDKCKTCKARKTVTEKKMLELHIDKGMKGGQRITFSGETDQAPGVIPGDLIIVIEEKPHERFKRNGDNLMTDVEIDLLTALGGGEFMIKHLDDSTLVVTIAPGEIVKQDDLKAIRGQGMPSQRHHEKGDLYVKFSIKWPEHIDPSKIHLLEGALPPRRSLPKSPGVTHVAKMSYVDPREERVMQEESMDEDDGGPRVQPANQ